MKKSHTFNNLMYSLSFSR